MAYPLPDPARYARDAAEAIGATYEDLDNGGGCLFRVSLNGRSLLAGAGAVCAFPVNAAVPFTIARDKAHTKAALKSASLPVIEGGLFFAHQRRVAMRGPGREIDDACAFAADLGFPVFAKPNLGSRGNFAELISDAAALRAYAQRLAAEYEAFLIEPVIDGDEHRVLVFDGRPIFHSAKSPPRLVGDGRHTLGQLLDHLNDALARDAISPWTISALGGRRPGDVLPAGSHVQLTGRRNLGAHGSVEHVSLHAPEALAALAAKAAQAIGLRLAAIDIFDVSPQRDFSDLRVIEINGNPGLQTLEQAGRRDVIRSLWIAMLNDQLGG